MLCWADLIQHQLLQMLALSSFASSHDAYLCLQSRRLLRRRLRLRHHPMMGILEMERRTDEKCFWK